MNKDRVTKLLRKRVMPLAWEVLKGAAKAVGFLLAAHFLG